MSLELTVWWAKLLTLLYLKQFCSKDQAVRFLLQNFVNVIKSTFLAIQTGQALGPLKEPEANLPDNAFI